MLPGEIPQEAVMVEVQHLQPEGLTDNRNRYTHLVKIGPWVFIAGQGPGDGHGGMPSDPVAQVDNVYRNLATAVESIGGKLTDIVKTTTYVVGREHFDAIQAARGGRFGDKPPTGTVVIVSGLARPEMLLEMEAVAYVE